MLYLLGLHEAANTFLWNLFWAKFTAAFLVSEQVRQSSLIADLNWSQWCSPISHSLRQIHHPGCFVLAHPHDGFSIPIPILPESSTTTTQSESVSPLTGPEVGLKSLNASWSGLWLAANAALLLQVLGWTLLLDPGWTNGRLLPLLKLLCSEAGSHLSLSASPMLKRGSHSPSPLMGVVSWTVTGGADLALMLEPWLPSLMGSTLILMQALLLCWPLDTLSVEWSWFLDWVPYDDECEGWEPDWSARGLDVKHGETWRRQSTGVMCWTACWCQWSCRQRGMRALEPWSGVISKGFHPQLHGSSDHVIDRACRNHTRTVGSQKEPDEQPHWVCWAHLREDLPECGGKLLSHPGPLVLMSVGQLFLPLGGHGLNLADLPGNQLIFPHILLMLFVEQFSLRLGLHLIYHLQLPQSHTEVEPLSVCKPLFL